MSRWVRLGGLGLTLFGVVWVFFMFGFRGWGFLYIFFGLYMLTSGYMYKIDPATVRDNIGGYPGPLGFILTTRIETGIYAVLSIIIWLFASPMILRIAGWLILTYTLACLYLFVYKKR
jgi:vacuolar-type H+-ATPase subunit I/STV1